MSGYAYKPVKQSGTPEIIHYTIRKLDNFSGKKAIIYAVILGKNKRSEFEDFIVNFGVDYEDAVDDIVETVVEIADTAGVVNEKFRLDEGGKWRYVWCLPNYDLPNPPLRLFCITYPEDQMIIVGGGRKTSQKWQDSPDLNWFGNIAKAIHDDIEKLKLKTWEDRDDHFSNSVSRQITIYL